MIEVFRYQSDPMDNNTILLVDSATRQAAIVDPSFETDRILEEVSKLNVDVRLLLLTHAHFDHAAGNRATLERFPDALFGMHRESLDLLHRLPMTLERYGFDPVESPEPHFYLEEGKSVRLGESDIQVLFTPGHAPGHVSFVFDDSAIVGDCLFRNSIGRTDLEGGSLELLLDSIRTRLLTLSDDTKVYPGHGSLTTIGLERRSNMHLKDI